MNNNSLMNTVKQYFFSNSFFQSKKNKYCLSCNKEKVYYNNITTTSTHIILGVGLLLFPLTIDAQPYMSKDSTGYAFSKSPAFSIFKDNYFISGTTLDETPSKDNSDAKFQFSFKQRLQNKPLVCGAYFYLTYTQKSFWNIYKSSSPFAESNYNPGLQLIKPIYKKDRFIGVFGVSIEHESNGRDSINSRSWNFVGINYAHFFSDKILASVKVFIPFGLSDNPDLNKYIGYSEAQFSWSIKKNRLILDVTGRKGAEWDTKGSLMTTLSFRPSVKRNLYWSIQWWQGYSESLIDYKQSTSMIRIGFTVKPTFYRFY